MASPFRVVLLLIKYFFPLTFYGKMPITSFDCHHWATMNSNLKYIVLS